MEENLIPKEFYDVNLVLLNGARKYGRDTYLQEEDYHLNFEDNCASMFRHLAKHTAGIDNDEESGLDHLLHLACRSLMLYTRKKRGLDYGKTDNV